MYENFPNKTPILKNNNEFFTITYFDLLNNEMIEESNIPHLEEVLEFCKDNARSRKEIQEFLNISSSSYLLQKIINPMVKSKYLITIGNKNSTKNKYLMNKEQ